MIRTFGDNSGGGGLFKRKGKLSNCLDPSFSFSLAFIARVVRRRALSGYRDLDGWVYCWVSVKREAEGLMRLFLRRE